MVKVISIYGSRNGQPHRFRENADYVLADPQSITWKNEGGELPDPGTLVTINYYTQDAQASLTDIYPGSVPAHHQRDRGAGDWPALRSDGSRCTRSAFIDTASGSALDKVVAILGVERVTGNHPAGEVLFTRVRHGPRRHHNSCSGTRITTSQMARSNTRRPPPSPCSTASRRRECPRATSSRPTTRWRDRRPADRAAGADCPASVGVHRPRPHQHHGPGRRATTSCAPASRTCWWAASAPPSLPSSTPWNARVLSAQEIVERSLGQPGRITVNTFTDQMSPELLQRVQTALERGAARPASSCSRRPSRRSAKDRPPEIRH